jgi:hypothetical protein
VLIFNALATLFRLPMIVLNTTHPYPSPDRLSRPFPATGKGLVRRFEAMD